MWHLLLLAQACAIDFRVVQEFPRNPKYTQGLQYLGNGVLLESNGMWGQSDIRKTNLTTGRVLVTGPKIPNEVFAEGATQHKGYIFQLTYLSRLIYVYDPTTLQLVQTLYNPHFTEGWGLTSDGTYLIASDGSATLYFLTSESMSQTGQLTLHHTLTVEQNNNNNNNIYNNINYNNGNNNRALQTGLNELEYINGVIYANIYPTSTIVFIDASNGKLLASLDMSPLLQRLLPSSSTPFTTSSATTPTATTTVALAIPPAPAPEVLNGIANYVNNSILITGKYWPKIFQVILSPSPRDLLSPPPATTTTATTTTKTTTAKNRKRKKAQPQTVVG